MLRASRRGSSRCLAGPVYDFGRSEAKREIKSSSAMAGKGRSAAQQERQEKLASQFIRGLGIHIRRPTLHFLRALRLYF